MKARITCDSNHPLGKLFESLFDVEYCSRSTGFDARDYDLSNFLNCTYKYDYTIDEKLFHIFIKSNL
jgi:hypothetical protein